MILRLQQIKVDLNYDDKRIRTLVAKRLKCSPNLLTSVEISRRSLDCRQKDPYYILTVDVKMKYDWDESKRQLPENTLAIKEEDLQQIVPKLSTPPVYRPVVVGAGPAGLFAALTLAEAGANPILIERGEAIEQRVPKVDEFWQTETLDEESNVLYGEGGAGLFSDGKLTARTKDRGRMHRIFSYFVEAGADPSILIDSEPHIGTDKLQEILPRIRQKLIELGGEIRFNNKLELIKQENGKLTSLIVNGEEIVTDNCVLAVGHSARDVYHMLHKTGVNIEAKPFAIGVRLELPQEYVDLAQYKDYVHDSRLPPASFKIISKEDYNRRSVYSFCMCPGGKVIVCASSKGTFTTNGMSYHDRDLSTANAAFLVPVGVEDFGGSRSDPLRGLKFQETLEENLFEYTKGRYCAVAQNLVDFMVDKTSLNLEEEEYYSCDNVVLGNIHDLLPEKVCESLTLAIPEMLKKLAPVREAEVTLYGIETRSSSPVKIVRDSKTLESVSTIGLYPCGEGAGYAGGITSSAIDGVHVAEMILKKYL